MIFNANVVQFHDIPRISLQVTVVFSDATYVIFKAMTKSESMERCFQLQLGLCSVETSDRKGAC